MVYFGMDQTFLYTISSYHFHQLQNHVIKTSELSLDLSKKNLKRL
uniref:Uncharacterized protein n=1 Tax=Lepeophtheirus salmonis TaxID=72036 RepID=A0A0K2VBS7_LEPSM